MNQSDGNDPDCVTEPQEPATFKGFTHQGCDYYPCHQGVRRAFNCLFCYCPLIERECPGPYVVYTDIRGEPRKDCSACRLPHEGINPSWRFIQRWLAAPRWRGEPQSRTRRRALCQALRNAPGSNQGSNQTPK